MGRPAWLDIGRAMVLDPPGSSMKAAHALQRAPARSCKTQREEGTRFDQCRLALQLFSALRGRLARKGLCPVWGLSWNRVGKQLFLPGGCK